MSNYIIIPLGKGIEGVVELDIKNQLLKIKNTNQKLKRINVTKLGLRNERCQKCYKDGAFEKKRASSDENSLNPEIIL
jgi:hypothetical protein